MEIPNSHQVFSLIDKSPNLIYRRIYNIGRVSIKRKIPLVAACLNDQKAIDSGQADPKDRNRVIKMIGKDLACLEAKIRIRELEEDNGPDRSTISE